MSEAAHPKRHEYAPGEDESQHFIEASDKFDRTETLFCQSRGAGALSGMSKIESEVAWRGCWP